MVSQRPFERSPSNRPILPSSPLAHAASIGLAKLDGVEPCGAEALPVFTVVDRKV